MIIVSQDKKSIYNFGNVKTIDVLGNEIFIADNILANRGILIGKYKTEDRAKEVLSEIMTAVSVKQLDGAKLEKDQIELILRMLPCNIYQMPEK